MLPKLPALLVVPLVLLLAIGATAAVSDAARCAPPVTITAGGSYSGCWMSRDARPAVRISTTEPVTIANSTVESPGVASLFYADVGAQVTLSHVTGRGGTGTFFTAAGIKSLVIQDSSISKTGGIYLLGAQPDATVTITRNRLRNLQAPIPDGTRSFVQFDKVMTAAIDVSWNEVVNVFGQSAVDGDMISVYKSSFAKIHDNYIQGAYPASVASRFSGSGIMIEQMGSHDNEIYSNQIVETTNAGIGISAGYNNKVYNNRLIFDGRLHSGTRLAGANVGIYVWNSAADPTWAENQAYGNHVGWVNARGARNDWWLPNCSGACANRPLSGALNRTRELAEYRVWLKKLAATGVRIGA